MDPDVIKVLNGVYLCTGIQGALRQKRGTIGLMGRVRCHQNSSSGKQNVACMQP